MTKRPPRFWLFLILPLTVFSVQSVRVFSKNAFFSGSPIEILACSPPTFVTATNFASDQATINWFPNVGVFDLEIRPNDEPFTGAPTHENIAASTFLAKNLLSGQLYHYQVRTNCGVEKSTWKKGLSPFRTLFSNPTRCGATYLLADAGQNCPKNNTISNFQIEIKTPATSLGNDIFLRGLRLIVGHEWRSDLKISLKSPDGTSVLLLDNLNAGDDNLGDPTAPGCSKYLELTNAPGVLPLSALVEVPNPTGRYLPRNNFSIFNNGQNPNGTWNLEILDLRADDCGTFYRAELVFEYQNCLAPMSVAVENVDKTSAEISWQPGGDCDSVFVEWGERGFLPGTENLPGGGAGFLKMACPAAQNLVLQNLVPFRFYDVYFRKKCAAGQFSINSEAARFFTDCPPTLIETFDNQPVCDETFDSDCSISGVWKNIYTDDFDWKIHAGPAPSTPLTGPHTDADRKLGNYLYFETTNPGGGGWPGSTAILQSACILVDTLVSENCQFSFDYFMWRVAGQPNQTGKLELEISNNNGQTWSKIHTISGQQPKRWQNVRLSLANWYGQVVQIRFVATAAANDFNDIALDNLRFYGTSDDLAADFIFYKDFDGDGFGSKFITLASCSGSLPAGFSTNSDDCDDSNAAVPTNQEIFCNQLDDDCDPTTTDGILPAPTAAGTSICAGTKLELQAVGQPIGQFYWFSHPAGGSPLAVGKTFSVQNFTQSRTYFLQDSTQGCGSLRVPVQAVALPSPFLTLDNPPAPICFGKNFDLADLPVFDVFGTTGNVSFHTALPANASNLLDSSVVSPQFQTVFYILKTTADGCKDDLAVTLGIRPNPSANITAGDSMAICKNSFQKITAFGSGGTAPYTFQWTGPALSTPLFFQNIDIRGATAGQTTTYSVLVKDDFGCTATDEIKVLTLNSVTSTQIAAKQDVQTCGGSDGSISLNPLNGQPPFTFSWKSSGNILSQTGSGVIQNLKQGNYRFTITDASTTGCSMVMPLIVLNAPGLKVAVDSVQNPSCPAAATGSILLNVQATAPTFLWSNQTTGQNLIGVAENSYSVTITDGACQQILNNIELVAPPQISILENVNASVSCFGGQNGSLGVQVFGGSQPYQYLWSNDSTGQNLENLAAGWYRVVVSDANFCEKEDSFLVSQPAKLLVSVPIFDSVQCFGFKNGSIRAFPSGGAGGFTYHWSNGANTAFVNNLPAGNFSVTLTDQNGCTATGGAVLVEPNLLKFDSFQIQNPMCLGIATGKISPKISGGSPQYFWNWDNGKTTPTLQNLSSGKYSVTVTDRRGCSVQKSNLEISAPQVLDISLDSLRQIRCFGEENGRIEIDVAGGDAPYFVEWNGFPDDFVLENLFAGDFTAIVRDANGCRDSATFSISAPSAMLENSLVNTKTPSCFGEFNGQIETKTVGGQPPYQFFWNTGKTTEDISEVPAGNYQLTVLDARGCSFSLPQIILGQPDLLATQYFPKNIPCNGTTGQIEIATTGGTTPYIYVWNFGDTTQNVYLLPAGNFAVTVTDANGCENKADSLKIVNTNFDFQVNPIFEKNISCFGLADGRIVVELNGGTAPFKYSWSHLPGFKTSGAARDTVFGLSAGTFSVFVEDGGGCPAFSQTFEIEEPPPLLIDSVFVKNNVCKGGVDGCIEVFAVGGTPDLTFLWNTMDSEPLVCDLTAGIYKFTVTDAAGCTASKSAVVGEPSQGLKIVADHIFQDTCGNCNGEISVHTEFGTPGYQYSWSNDFDQATNTGLCPGEYFVMVTDQNQCTAVDSFEVSGAANLMDLESEIQDVRCAGDETGSIEVFPTGGQPDYSFAWNEPNLFGDSIANLAGGIYTLTLVDAVGCSKVYSFKVFEPSPIEILDIQKDSVPGAWNLTFEIGGGNDPYSVEIFDLFWNLVPGGGAGLQPGYYHVLVTDSSGCVFKKEFVSVGTVATGQPEMVEFLEIFPNPTDGFSLIKLKLREASAMKIQVLDATGRVVFWKNFAEKQDEFGMALDFSRFPAGVFFVEIVLENGETVGKRVVLK